MLSALVSSARWTTFSLLNQLADIRSPSPKAPYIHPPRQRLDKARGLIWVFCSTIGEVNACLPFISKLQDNGQLVLMTDHNCYRDGYQRYFPDAYVVELTGRVTDAHYLVQHLPPTLFIICEIPAMPSDAPCRLSYGMLYEARKAGASVHLVNGWLYGYKPSCHMDSMEVRLLRQDYLDAFDTLCVQNRRIRSTLMEAGAREDRISITGNMKFDSLRNTKGESPDPVTREVLGKYCDSNSPIVVAGCLAELEECYSLFEAITLVRKTLPEAQFIIAPRHPENRAFMQSMTKRLDKLNLPYRFKSQYDADKFDNNALLIIDTFGELKDFYSFASVCYVGCNHNVLEPLSFGKATIVSGDWNPLYPSYPVYQMTREKEMIHHAEGAQGICDEILSNASENKSNSDISQTIQNQLYSLSGAVERTLKIIDPGRNPTH